MLWHLALLAVVAFIVKTAGDLAKKLTGGVFQPGRSIEDKAAVSAWQHVREGLAAECNVS